MRRVCIGAAAAASRANRRELIVTPNDTHYATLGVAADASAADIRAAYRRAARAHHPDTHGESSAVQMAAVNEAWRVLGDQKRRQVYDASLGSAAAGRVMRESRPAASEFIEPRHNPLARYQDPPRFPWRLMAWLAAGGAAFVVLGVLTASDPVPPKVDNVLNPGDCAVIEANGDAAERLCTEPHDATVQVLVAANERCPDGTEPHRDRQGMGTACLVLI